MVLESPLQARSFEGTYQHGLRFAIKSSLSKLHTSDLIGRLFVKKAGIDFFPKDSLKRKKKGPLLSTHADFYTKFP